MHQKLEVSEIMGVETWLNIFITIRNKKFCEQLHSVESTDKNNVLYMLQSKNKNFW